MIIFLHPPGGAAAGPWVMKDIVGFKFGYTFDI